MMRSSASFYLLDRHVKAMKTPEMVALASIGGTVNVFVGDRKLSLTLRYTCENFWKVTAFDFLEGGPYQLSHIQARERVVVINEATRDAHFGKGRQAVGQTVEINGQRYRVMGVVRNVSVARLVTAADLYLPYTASDNDLTEKRLMGEYFGIIQAGSRAELATVQAEYDQLIDKLEKQLPDYLAPENADSGFTELSSTASSILETVSQVVFQQDEGTVTRFWIVAGIIILLFMLLPALNLINLNVSRIQERSSEIGVRKAFGADAGTLVVQFIVENIIITLIGGVFALLLAWGGLRFIESLELIHNAELTINFTIFLLAIAFCLLFGLLSGVLPALRMSKIKIVDALKGPSL